MAIEIVPMETCVDCTCVITSRYTKYVDEARRAEINTLLELIPGEVTVDPYGDQSYYNSTCDVCKRSGNGYFTCMLQTITD